MRGIGSPGAGGGDATARNCTFWLLAYEPYGVGFGSQLGGAGTGICCRTGPQAELDGAALAASVAGGVICGERHGLVGA